VRSSDTKLPVVHHGHRAARQHHSVRTTRSDAAARPSTTQAETVVGSLTILLLVIALLFGGGTSNYLISDLFVQLLAAVLLVYGVNRLRWQKLPLSIKQLLLILVAVLAIPILQLIPLPTALLMHLPGRRELWQTHQSLGIQVPMFAQWSLDPNASLAALRAMLPAAAFAVLGCQLQSIWLKRLALIVIVFAVLSVVIGVAQLAQGPASELRPYMPTNTADAVGLFANRNHYAALLVSALILVLGGLMEDGYIARPGVRKALRLCGWILLASIFLLGIALAGSRAAAGLAVGVSAIMVLMAMLQKRDGRNPLTRLALVLAIGGFVAFQYGFLQIVERFGQKGEEYRWAVLPDVLSAASQYAWLGSGLGSFPSVYAALESIDMLTPGRFQHAHNDWAELWVDVGLIFVVVALAFFVWCWKWTRELFNTGLLAQQQHIVRIVGGLLIFVLCLHSLVDYPLRTTTLSVIFTLACLFFAQPLTDAARTARS